MSGMIKELRKLNDTAERLRGDRASRAGSPTGMKYAKKDSFRDSLLQKMQVDEGDMDSKPNAWLFETTELHRHRQIQFVKREQREYDDMMKKISFSTSEGYAYSGHMLKPCAQFFQWLVKPHSRGEAGLDPDEKNIITATRVQLRIPPTVVGGVSEHPILYYTDTSGSLCRCDSATLKNIKSVLGIKTSSTMMYESNLKANEVILNVEPVTVLKRPKYSENTNEIHYLNAKSTENNLQSSYSTITVVQKYIKSKGPSAAITRFVWNAGHRGCYAYQISNRVKYDDIQKEKDPMKRYIASSDNAFSLTVFNMKGKSLIELNQMTTDLVVYICNIYKPRPLMEQFVCDFIKDQQGVWWYIQTKAFKMCTDFIPGSLSDHKEDASPPTSPLAVQHKVVRRVYRTMTCGICGNAKKPRELEFTLTLKMIHTVEKHLKRHGKYRSWFNRPELKVIDSPLWYQPRRVCKECFEMFMKEQKLENAELLFAKAIGIPVDAEQQEIAYVLQNYNRRTSNLKAVSSVGKRETLMTMYRLVIYIYDIHNLPELQNMSNLYLKIDFLYTTLKLPIKIVTKSPDPIIPINKLRMFHFFTAPNEEISVAASPKSAVSAASPLSFGDHPPSAASPSEVKAANTSQLRHFMQQQKEVVLHLWHNTMGSIGQCRLPLHQFEGTVIEKLDYVKLMSISIPTNANDKMCYVRVTLGVIKGRDIPVDDIPLRKHTTGVWVPSEEYYSVDALPEEWMQLVLGKNVSGDWMTTGEGSAAQYTLAADTMIDSLGRRDKEDISAAQLRVSYSGWKTSWAQGKGKGLSVMLPNSLPEQKEVGRKVRQARSQKAAVTTTSHTQSGPAKSSNVEEKHVVSGGRRRSTIVHYDKTFDDDKPDEAMKKHLSELQLPVVVWCLQIHIQTITDLFSSADESWVINYSILGEVIKHESFQLFDCGPLVFDAETIMYVYCEETNIFLKYLREFGKLKVTLSPKYNVMIVQEVEIALQPLVSEAAYNSNKTMPWTGTAIQGVFSLSQRATLLLEKEEGDGSSVGVRSASDGEVSVNKSRSIHSGKKGQKEKSASVTRRKSVDASPQRNKRSMKVFNLNNDEYDDDDDEDGMFTPRQHPKKRPVTAEGDSYEEADRMYRSYSMAVPSDGPASSRRRQDDSSSGSQSGGEEEEEERKPQLAVIIKLSKVNVHHPLQNNIKSIINTSFGNLVYLTGVAPQK